MTLFLRSTTDNKPCKMDANEEQVKFLKHLGVEVEDKDDGDYIAYVHSPLYVKSQLKKVGSD